MPRAERKARVARILGFVGLGSFASRLIDGLSGGERQRVALARALVSEPEAILLDEPLSALDPHLRRQTLDLLRDIQSRLKVTYLYVTHDREEALRAAHRIGVLNHGKLEQVGTPEEVYARPRTAFVASFIGPINWLHGEIAMFEDRPRLLTSNGWQLPLDGRIPPEVRRLILGVRPEDLRLGREGFLKGRVIDRQFTGSTITLRLDIGESDSMTAERRVDETIPPLGEEVHVDWAPHAAHLFGEPK